MAPPHPLSSSGPAFPHPRFAVKPGLQSAELTETNRTATCMAPFPVLRSNDLVTLVVERPVRNSSIPLVPREAAGARRPSGGLAAKPCALQRAWLSTAAALLGSAHRCRTALACPVPTDGAAQARTAQRGAEERFATAPWQCKPHSQRRPSPCLHTGPSSPVRLRALLFPNALRALLRHPPQPFACCH